MVEEAVNSNSELVSVLMATYNDKLTFLEAAIDSILAQSYLNIELIIVDDSTDLDVIAFLQKKAGACSRIQFIHNPVKLGFVRSLNVGLRGCKGAYIARMDSDDIAMPGRIAKQVEYLRTNREVDIVGTAICIIDDNGAITGRRQYKSSFFNIRRNMYYRNPVAHPTVMMRASVPGKIGLYDESFVMAEDYEYWLRAVKRGLIINNLPDALLQYRLTSDYHTKRTRINWQYNLKAKVKNFDSRYWLFNLLGCMVPILFMVMPDFIMKMLYNRERKKSFFY